MKLIHKSFFNQSEKSLNLTHIYLKKCLKSDFDLHLMVSSASVEGP